MSKSMLSRRAILAGAAALPIAAAATPSLAAGDDAELLRLSVKLEAMEEEWLRVTVPELKNLAAHQAGLPDPCPHMTDDENDDFTDRLFSVVEEIQLHKAATLAGLAVLTRKAATLAGLAVLTRACVLGNATEWVNGDGDERDRCFIEVVCDFLGITPITDLAEAAVDGSDDGRFAS
jgi:hypothetical protein